LKPPSIRTRLQLWLLPSLVLILGAFSVFDFHRAIEPVEAAYDAALANTAFAVSARLRAEKGTVALDLDDQTVALLRTDLIDRIFFRVISPTNETLAGDIGLKGPENIVGPTFFDTMFQDKPVRGIAYPVATPIGVSVVLVAETTVKRDKARRDMVASRLVQDLAVVFFCGSGGLVVGTWGAATPRATGLAGAGSLAIRPDALAGKWFPNRGAAAD